MKKIIVVLLLLSMGIVGWWYAGKQMPLKKQIPLEDVTLKLKWIHQAQFAGNYVAAEKGYYTSEGLNVELLPYALGENVIDTVISGKADYGIAGADEILLAREAGKLVKAVAVIYKTSPVVAFSLAGSGITKPTDFIGKKVGIEKGVNVEYLYIAMLKKLGINRSKINEVAIGFDVSEILTGRVDVSTGYIINEPQLAIEAGKKVNMILMADYGVNMYADVLFTTDKTIKERPEEVRRIVRASMQGWQYAIENQSEAVDVTMKYAKDTTRQHQESMLSASVPLINTGKGHLGEMEKLEWESAQNILFDQGIMKTKIDVSDVFTSQFTDAIYKK